MPSVPKIPQFEVRRSEKDPADLLILFTPPLETWQFTEPGLAVTFIQDVNARVEEARQKLPTDKSGAPSQTQENLTWLRAVILTALAFWFATGKVSIPTAVQMDLPLGGKTDEA